MQTANNQSKKKRLLVAAGIFVLPVLVIALVIFGLTRSKKKANSAATGTSAFNAHFPAPNLPKADRNKFEMYMQAQQDSVKLKEQQDKDPNLKTTAVPDHVPSFPKSSGNPTGEKGSFKGDNGITPSQDANEKKVNDQLQRLYSALGSKKEESGDTRYSPVTAPVNSSTDNNQLSKLEFLMASLQKKDTVPDAKLQQVNTVLDKVLDIQHPERVSQHPVSPGAPNLSLAVGTLPPGQSADNPGPNNESTGSNGFYGLDEGLDSSTATASAIEAVINEDQTVQSGSIVKLRLMQDIFVGGHLIPANTFIFGPCSIDGERVNIQLSDAIYDSRIYPIKLRVFDAWDGLQGLFVPGAITRDVVKEGVAQGVGGVNIGSLDPSLSAQALSAGIETTKDLISRKIRIVKVTLKAGHLAILRIADTNH